MIKSYNNQSGSVLLYSLLVISLITAIAIIISVIVVNEIKLTSAASNGIQAYYASESGIEKGLHTVKILRNNQEDTLEEVRDRIITYSDNNFENNASYENIESDIITAKVENIEVLENDFIQIDYYDVVDPLNPTIEVVGITVKNSGIDPATWAEVSWTAWDSNGVLGTSTSAKKIIGPSDLARENGWPINDLNVFAPDSNTGFDGDPVGYRVKIKALKAIPTEVGNGNLSSLTVIPYDDPPPPLGTGQEVTGLPTLLVIKSVGERNNFKQSLEATVPWNLPLFGLYDYVLFSEGEILKDIILSAPTYSSGKIEIEANIDPAASCNPKSCADCRDVDNWNAVCPNSAPNVACFGGNNLTDLVSGVPISGQCNIKPANSLLGFTLPISDTVPAGDEYYLSYRAFYDCTDGICNNRDIAFEISGNSFIASDPVTGYDEVWQTCTLPDTFSLGNPTLPADDPTRTLKISNHPYGNTWTLGDVVRLDWYQLSSYKIFPDCY